MKGFQIQYKDKVSNVAAPDGMVTINIFQIKDDVRMNVQSSDYEKLSRNIWYDSLPIEFGDKINIQVKDLEQLSTPESIVEDAKIKRPKTKLEIFREVEDRLKKKGLL